MLKKVFPILLGAGIGFAAAKLIEKMNENDSTQQEEEDEILAGCEDDSEDTLHNNSNGNTSILKLINSNHPQSTSDNSTQF